MNRLIPYYRARYYSQQMGRFISRDPLSDAELSQGPNLYAYVQDNAPNAVDPSGLISPGGAVGSSLDIAHLAAGAAESSACIAAEAAYSKAYKSWSNCIDDISRSPDCCQSLADAADKANTTVSKVC